MNEKQKLVHQIALLVNLEDISALEKDLLLDYLKQLYVLVKQPPKPKTQDTQAKEAPKMELPKAPFTKEKVEAPKPNKEAEKNVVGSSISIVAEGAKEPIKEEIANSKAATETAKKPEQEETKKRPFQFNLSLSDDDDVIEKIEPQPIEEDQEVKPLSPEKLLEAIDDREDVFIVEQNVKINPANELLSSMGLKKKPNELLNKNIFQAIGLNDRLWFMSTLFGGDHQKYQAAFDEINLIDNAEDAKQILKNLIVKNDAKKEEQDKAIDQLHLIIDHLYGH